MRGDRLVPARIRNARAAIAIALGGIAALAAVIAWCADGVWQDLALNVFAETLGVGIVLFIVDQMLEAERKRARNKRRKAALEDLRFTLIELQQWLSRLFLQSKTGLAWFVGEGDPDRIPIESFIDHLPRYLGTIDFASAGLAKRDRYFIEWSRRTFETTHAELERWERSFAGAAGIFDDDFREGTEPLHSFTRAMRSFLEGIERYILRTEPTSPVHAYEGITELTEDDAGRFVRQLHEFLDFYRRECARYNAEVPQLGMILR